MRSLSLLVLSFFFVLGLASAATARPTPGPYLNEVRMTIAEEKAMIREYNARERAEAHARQHAIQAAQEAEPEPVPEPQPAMSIDWDTLAQCESHGEWDYGPHSGWGSGLFEGGLQFNPGTWDAYKPAGYPEAAYQASREQQILVAEKVLDAQGLGAWPACTRKLGWR